MNQLRPLRPYQQELLEKIKTRYRVSLFWRMRVGKTMPIIRWVQHHEREAGQKLRVLIIALKTPMVSWIEELEKENQPFQVFSTLNKDIHHWMLSPVWALTNYECLTASDTYLHDLPWDAVILDESTKIRNPNTKITRTIIDNRSFPIEAIDHKTNISYKSPLKYQLRAILTGTPAPETDLDYYCQMKFLYGRFFNCRNYWNFKRDFFELGTGRHSRRYTPKPMVRTRIAAFMKKHAFMLGHKQAKMELPNVYKKHFVEMAALDRKIYDEYEQNWFSDRLTEIIKEFNPNNRSVNALMTQFAMVAQNYLHQIACGFPKTVPEFSAKHKLNELIDLSSNGLAKEKIVVWCRYSREIEEIYRALKQKTNRKPLTITGKDNVTKLKSKLDSFNLPTNANYSSDTAICQIKKGSMGMNLSASDIQIFFSRSWSSLDNLQCVDRIIHPLKKFKEGFQSLLTIDIVTKNTIDELVIQALIDKKTEIEILKLFMNRIKDDNTKKCLEQLEIVS